ncbi:hypothetical protein [Pseudoroseomonas cervicalis]|uniref:hypothetical protein n=1 Tax=Teichococcus cervicalis TaxID=204525 RepID=UPI0022F1AA66|nr:hypothetical protein [Pseudoroseomonas cervicalis]WBV42587.1 hypothetical protein PFY06_15280 [Pseudoroseomonas cervicalis]
MRHPATWGRVALMAWALAAAPAGPAWAELWIGFGYGYVPLSLVPPGAALPPAHPPPAYPYAAPDIAPVAPAPPGQPCHAGAYLCPTDRPAYPGQACSCPAKGGERAWGRVGG